MASKRTRSEVGDFIAVPLDKATYAFGRVLPEYIIAFYNFISSKIEPISVISTYEISFSISVYPDAINSGKWQIIGNSPLEPNLKRPIKFVRKDPISGRIDIYEQGRFSPVTDEDVSSLERLAVWQSEHVEERLRNHFAGRRDATTEMLRTQKER